MPDRSDAVKTQRILVTGSQGFIGKNLTVHLRETGQYDVVEFVRGDDSSSLKNLMASIDAVIHLAGENRPTDEKAFELVNKDLTETLCDAISASGRAIKLILASSTQAERDNPYGRSKLAAENAVRSLAEQKGISAVIFRLPGVFGKWCKPNYNSVVATFCHNIARGIPIQVNDPSAKLRLVYVDDVVASMMTVLESPPNRSTQEAKVLINNSDNQPQRTPTVGVVSPEYSITLGELAKQIKAFEGCRTSLMTERVGTGFVRALYSTYISYLPQERFSYEIEQHSDPRGTFVEMLKTPDSGQFSYFTAHPGVTRGGHYHHTKTEKFLVIKGQALFRFRHLLTGERFELKTTGDKPKIVDTIPGWVHDITNVGEDEMIVMLWANENFDRTRPDTINHTM